MSKRRTVTIAGREHPVRLTFRHLAEFEERTGRSALSEETWSQPRAADVAVLVWLATGGAGYDTPEALAEDLDVAEGTRAMVTLAELIAGNSRAGT